MRPPVRRLRSWLAFALALELAATGFVLWAGVMSARYATRLEAAPAGVAVTSKDLRLRVASWKLSKNDDRGEPSKIGLVFVLATVEITRLDESLETCALDLVTTDLRTYPGRLPATTCSKAAVGTPTPAQVTFEITPSDAKNLAGIAIKNYGPTLADQPIATPGG